MMSRRPLWPPAEPERRSRRRPSGRSTSSATTSRSSATSASVWRSAALQRAAGQVHVPQRLDQQHASDRLRPRRPRARAAPSLTRPCAGQAPSVGEQVDHAKADVVAREPIALARIAQAADHLHRAADGSRLRSTSAYARARCVTEIVVIGGGIIGCAAAAILADRGARVTLVERTAIGAGASGRNLGAIQHPFDPVLAPLYHDSLTRYRQLALADDGLRHRRRPAGLLLLNRDPESRRADRCIPARGGPRASPRLRSPPTSSCSAEPSLRHGPAAVRLATGYPIPPASATRRLGRPGTQRGAQIQSDPRRRRGRGRRRSRASARGRHAARCRRGPGGGRPVDAARWSTRRAAGARSVRPGASRCSSTSAPRHRATSSRRTRSTP